MSHASTSQNGVEPDPVWAAAEAELGGADGITIHLREDRRHIQERDLRILKETVSVKLNLEIACEPEVCAIALDVQPDQVCLVPEKRQEVTTEGGLDVVGSLPRVSDLCHEFHQAGIIVSLLSTRRGPSQSSQGCWCTRCRIAYRAIRFALEKNDDELHRLIQAGKLARDLGLVLNAGHGLNYVNVQPVAAITGMDELNIGHSIVSRSLFSGLRTLFGI